MLFAKSQKKLFIVAGILFLLTVVVVVFSKISDSSSGQEPAFPVFDTAAVTVIKMTPKGGDGEVVFRKKAGKWLITTAGKNPKTFEASVMKMDQFIGTLADLRAVNLVARTGAERGKYGLDTGYTRVRLFAGESEVFAIHIGRAEMISPQEMGSYVRPENSDDIFLVSGFLDMIFNSDVSLYRSRQLGFGGVESWQEIKFTGRDNFMMIRSGLDWLVDGKKLDSAKVTEYLATFASLEGNEFADDKSPGKNDKFLTRVDVKTVSGRGFTISAFVTGKDTVISSSLSPGSFFKAGSDAGIFRKLFPGLAGLK